MTKDFLSLNHPKFRKLLRQPQSRRRGIVDMLGSQGHCLQHVPCWAESESESLAYHLKPQGRDLDVTVDVESVVFRGQHHTPVVHQGHIKALGMFHLALESRYQLSLLREDGEVEVVVVVSDGDFAGSVDANSNWVVGDTFATNLTEEVALVIKDLHTVGAVVANENLLSVIDDYSIRELEVFRAAKLVEDVPQLVKNDHSHHLALDHNNPPFVVDANTPRVLQDVGSKLADELAVLVVNLDLVRR